MAANSGVNNHLGIHELNSIERSRAAFIAWKTNSAKPESVKLFKAAAVVPLGLVTFSRSVFYSFPLFSTIRAAPMRVWLARVTASSWLIPKRLAAPTTASVKAK